MSEPWEGDAYAAQSAHHRSLDEWFLNRHPPSPGDVVVDAGSGSGEFALRLAELVPDGRVIGVEPDASMLAAAEGNRRDNLEFRHGAIQELDAICGAATADFVVSRAVFHWIPWPEWSRCYEAVLATLQPGGWFHAESGATGNVARVVEVLDEVAVRHDLPPADVTFPDAGRALELLEDVGFEVPPGGVTTVAQRRPFTRETVEGFLCTQASLAWVTGADPAQRAAFLDDVVAGLDAFRRSDGTYDQTFVRLDVLCRRPQ